MLGMNSVTAAVARSTISLSASSASISSNLFRALSTTTESLKVKSTTPPPVANQAERIKYFKIYRWDPDHRQKPVSIELYIFDCHFPHYEVLTHSFLVILHQTVPLNLPRRPK